MLKERSQLFWSGTYYIGEFFFSEPGHVIQKKTLNFTLTEKTETSYLSDIMHQKKLLAKDI